MKKCCFVLALYPGLFPVFQCFFQHATLKTGKRPGYEASFVYLNLRQGAAADKLMSRHITVAAVGISTPRYFIFKPLFDNEVATDVNFTANHRNSSSQSTIATQLSISCSTERDQLVLCTGLANSNLQQFLDQLPFTSGLLLLQQCSAYCMLNLLLNARMLIMTTVKWVIILSVHSLTQSPYRCGKLLEKLTTRHLFSGTAAKL